MPLTDDLDMPEWQRRRNTQRHGIGDTLAGRPLSDDMPMDLWQQVRTRQAAGMLAGGSGNNALAGGAGPDKLTGAPSVPEFDVDRDFLAAREGSKSTMYVPTYDKSTKVIGNSGPTIGVGVDLGRKDIAYLSSLNLQPTLVARLSPYLGKQRQDALAFVNAKPLALSDQEVRALNSAVQDREFRKLAAKYDAASQVGPFRKLPRDTQTAIGSLYFQYGTDAPDKAAPNYWRQITTGDWEAAHGNLMDFKDGSPDRRRLEAARLWNDIRAGKLPRRPQAKSGT